MVRHTQTIRHLLPMNCLSVFDHFLGLALKGLRAHFMYFWTITWTKTQTYCKTILKIIINTYWLKNDTWLKKLASIRLELRWLKWEKYSLLLMEARRCCCLFLIIKRACETNLKQPNKCLYPTLLVYQDPFKVLTF